MRGSSFIKLNARINKCQLRLFGHGDQKRVIRPIDKRSQEIRQAIEAGLVNGRLSCATAWKISDQFGVAKIEIAAACEFMKIKICSCQLGAFE